MIMKTKTKFMIMIPLLTMVAFLLPIHTKSLVPYTRAPFWDFFFFPPAEDPSNILEHSPLTFPRSGFDIENALSLPRADWKETPTSHLISLDIPGMNKDDVKIELEDDRILRVSGERKTEEEIKDERWHRAERTVGKFWRQFRLPANADSDNIKAKLEDGVLKITVPKLPNDQGKKREAKIIPITIAADEQRKSGEPIVVKPEL